jgi:hypothetical protein
MFMLSSRGLMAGGCALACFSSQAQVTPVVLAPCDFGLVNPSAVLIDQSHASAYLFTKKLTFTLDSSAEVRLDMRHVASLYRGNYLSGLYNASISLYDDAQTLLGTSVVDTSFAQGMCNTSGGDGCTQNRGQTLTMTLAAGHYTMEVQGVDGTLSLKHTLPDLYYGVSKTSPEALGAYLQRITPPDAIPEASTTAMWLLGGLAGGVLARRRRAHAA